MKEYYSIAYKGGFLKIKCIYKNNDIKNTVKLIFNSEITFSDNDSRNKAIYHLISKKRKYYDLNRDFVLKLDEKLVNSSDFFIKKE